MNSVKSVFSKKYIKKYEEKIGYLNDKDKVVLENFLLTRLFVEIVLVILCLLIPKYGILVAASFTPLFHFIYTEIVIDRKIEKRCDNLYNEAIIFYSMLLLNYNQTQDLKTSLDIVTNKLGNSISKEFKKVLGNNKFNNDLNEAFNEVIKTIPNSDIKTSLIDLKDCDDIKYALENIISSLQEKDIVLNRGRYQFKPIYISFVSLCFLSLIIVIILNLINIINFINGLLHI